MGKRGQSSRPELAINIRPPSFERRFIASDTDDANTLVALAGDESYFVRRQAVKNPHTPPWILDLLTRAGATVDLRGRSTPDPDLDAAALRRLAETGPWARQLVVEHPNTSSDVLTVLKDQQSIPMRLAIAAHRNATPSTLATLCADIEDDVRAQALANPNCSLALIDTMVAAGASADLQGISRQFEHLDDEQLLELSNLGAWGRFLVARHPDCPRDLQTTIAHDSDWRVRSGLLDNPHTPVALLEELLLISLPEDVQIIQLLGQKQANGEILSKLSQNRNPEVRVSLARHPSASAESLALLMTDGFQEIRRQAARHPRSRAADLERLIRAGSTPDLLGLSTPDASMTPDEIHTLLSSGVWARQLAVRNPNTGAETLARLLCDREPKIREWAAVHPNLPSAIKRDLCRAGSGSDFQGFMPPDPELAPDVLDKICKLGSWGEWVVANNPYSPPDLLESLAVSIDPQVRLFVACNPATPEKARRLLAEADPTFGDTLISG